LIGYLVRFRSGIAADVVSAVRNIGPVLGVFVNDHFMTGSTDFVDEISDVIDTFSVEVSEMRTYNVRPKGSHHHLLAQVDNSFPNNHERKRHSQFSSVPISTHQPKQQPCYCIMASRSSNDVSFGGMKKTLSVDFSLTRKRPSAHRLGSASSVASQFSRRAAREHTGLR
jgi:hypothetical protein